MPDLKALEEAARQASVRALTTADTVAKTATESAADIKAKAAAVDTAATASSGEQVKIVSAEEQAEQLLYGLMGGFSAEVERANRIRQAEKELYQAEAASRVGGDGLGGFLTQLVTNPFGLEKVKRAKQNLQTAADATKVVDDAFETITKRAVASLNREGERRAAIQYDEASKRLGLSGVTAGALQSAGSSQIQAASLGVQATSSQVDAERNKRNDAANAALRDVQRKQADISLKNAEIMATETEAGRALRDEQAKKYNLTSAQFTQLINSDSEFLSSLLGATDGSSTFASGIAAMSKPAGRIAAKVATRTSIVPQLSDTLSSLIVDAATVPLAGGKTKLDGVAPADIFVEKKDGKGKPIPAVEATIQKAAAELRKIPGDAQLERLIKNSQLPRTRGAATVLETVAALKRAVTDQDYLDLVGKNGITSRDIWEAMKLQQDSLVRDVNLIPLGLSSEPLMNTPLMLTLDKKTSNFFGEESTVPEERLFSSKEELEEYLVRVRIKADAAKASALIREAGALFQVPSQNP